MAVMERRSQFPKVKDWRLSIPSKNDMGRKRIFNEYRLLKIKFIRYVIATGAFSPQLIPIMERRLLQWNH